MDYQTPDSASTASAIYSGVKTKYQTLGFDSGIYHNDEASEKTANKVKGILKWAQDAEMDTGKHDPYSYEPSLHRLFSMFFLKFL